MSEFQKLFESVFPNNTDQLRASEKKQMLYDFYRTKAIEKSNNEKAIRSKQEALKRKDKRYIEIQYKINFTTSILSDLEKQYNKLDKKCSNLQKELSAIEDEMMKDLKYIPMESSFDDTSEITLVNDLYKRSRTNENDLYEFHQLFKDVFGEVPLNSGIANQRDMLINFYRDIKQEQHYRDREEYVNIKTERQNNNNNYKTISKNIDDTCKKMELIERDIAQYEENLQDFNKAQSLIMKELGEAPKYEVVIPEIQMINELYNEDRNE
jgi:chromosome segregation ATPase